MITTEKKREYEGMAGLFLVTVVWGWGFVFANMALEAGVSPAAAIFMRFFISVVLVGVFFGRTIRKNLKKADLKGSVITGIALFLGYFIQMLGLARSTPSNNAFITSAYVVIVPFLWWIVSKKRPRTVVFASSVLSLGGVAVLSFEIGGAGLTVNSGDLLTLLSAFFFALQIIFTEIYAAKIHHMALVFIQFCVASVLGFIALLIMGFDLSPVFTVRGGLAVLYIGAASTFFCLIIQTIAQRHVPSSKTSVIMSMESLFGAIFSMIVGYDSPSVRIFAGGFMLLAAVLLSEVKFRTKN